MDAEQRFQLLESEMNLIKGEVKQILVDLREFVMGERRPFPNLARSGPAANYGNGKPVSVPTEHRVSAPVEMEEPMTPVAQDASLMDVPFQDELGDGVAVSGGGAVASALEGEEAPSSVIPVTDAAVETGDASPTPNDQVYEVGATPAERVISTAPTSCFCQGTALDANLVANLIRWVAAVKARLGAEQLLGLLEVYKLTGHLPEAIEKLVLRVADLEALPGQSTDREFTTDSLMDYIIQLHGMIYGPGHLVSASLQESKPASVRRRGRG